MKAIIIAAGIGKRLLPLTENTHKSLLPIRGKPIIKHSIDNLSHFGIYDISIVLGHFADKIKDAVKNDLTFYHNYKYNDNNILHSLFYAEKEMNSNFICLYSDIIYDKEIIGLLLHDKEDICLVVDTDWKSKYIGRSMHPESEAEKVILKDNIIIKIGKHIFTEEADGEFIGIAKFSSNGAEIIKEVFNDIKNKYKMNEPFQSSKEFQKAYLTDLFQELADRGYKIHTLKIKSNWREIDTIQDYANAGGDLINSP